MYFDFLLKHCWIGLFISVILLTIARFIDIISNLSNLSNSNNNILNTINSLLSIITFINGILFLWVYSFTLNIDILVCIFRSFDF